MAQEIAMRRLFVTVAAMLVSCGVAHAQSTTTMPAIGATSPLGVPGSTSAGSPTGIPLGATELDPGGLSPAPIGSTATGSNCVGTGSSFPGMAAPGGTGSGTAGMSSTFDGGGGSTAMAPAMSSPGTATPTTPCASTSAGAISSTGMASSLSSPAANGASTLNGGTIPLGSTEMDSPGVSPMIGVGGPNSLT